MAISQLEMIALANILLGVFFITFMLILTNALRVFLLKIGIYLNAYAAILVLRILLSSTTLYNRISKPTLLIVGFCMTGSTAVTVFLVNNCWRAIMTIIKLKV